MYTARDSLPESVGLRQSSEGSREGATWQSGRTMKALDAGVDADHRHSSGSALNNGGLCKVCAIIGEGKPRIMVEVRVTTPLL